MSSNPAPTSAKSPEAALIAGLAAGLSSVVLLILIFYVLWRTRKPTPYLAPQPEKIAPARAAQRVPLPRYDRRCGSRRWHRDVDPIESKDSSEIRVRDTSLDAKSYLQHSMHSSRTASADSTGSVTTSVSASASTAPSGSSHRQPLRGTRAFNAV
ncbi:hypothetical protein EW145_g4821 [Phellinidium pouzarii]|uniref:Uncharacterized protein n=1 Tax=Phellinidium pouzarii TaxID=167371 RepID=A0A4S4L253_9AGAM|nr:hypothetical protein EW145_g4821 [Phellinidium pouzarii]